MEGNPTAPAPDAGRRTVVSWLLGGGVAASLASFFYPVARFLDPPQVAEVSVNEVAAGKVQDLKPNSGKVVKFGNKPALLPQRHLRPRGQGGLRTAPQAARRDGGENPRRRSHHFKTRVTGGTFTCQPRKLDRKSVV